MGGQGGGLPARPCTWIALLALALGLDPTLEKSISALGNLKSTLLSSKPCREENRIVLLLGRSEKVFVYLSSLGHDHSPKIVKLEFF